MLATVPLRSVFVTTSGPAAVVIVLLYVFNSSRGAFLFSEKMTLVRGEPTSGALWTLKVSLFSPDLERFFLWPLGYLIRVLETIVGDFETIVAKV